MTTISGEQVVDPGGTLTLTCVVTDAMNTTQVMWTDPAGTTLNETNSSFDNTSSTLESILAIDDLEYVDGGTYTCSDPMNSTTIFIVIRPTIYPSELTAISGTTTSNLTCNVQSSFASNIDWYMYDLRGSEGQITTGSGSGMMAYMDSMLDFMTVTFTDAGLYQCEVNATGYGLGEIRSNNATLTGKHRCPLVFPCYSATLPLC